MINAWVGGLLLMIKVIKDYILSALLESSYLVNKISTFDYDGEMIQNAN